MLGNHYKKKQKLKVTLILVLFGFTLSSALAEWRFREHDKKTGLTYRLDYDSIQKIGVHVNFRLLVDLSKPFANGTVSIEQHYRIDCATKQIQWEKKLFFTEPLGEGSPLTVGENTNPQWGHPLKGSFYERSLNFVCEFIQ